MNNSYDGSNDDGFDRYGYNKSGYDKSGFDEDKYDMDGCDEDGNMNVYALIKKKLIEKIKNKDIIIKI